MGAANAIAVIIFIIAGKVVWPQTCVILVATIAGGLIGGRYTKKLNPVKLRKRIVVFNFVITAIFFIKTYC